MYTPVYLGSISHDAELFLVYWATSREFINQLNYSSSQTFPIAFAQGNRNGFQFLSPIQGRLYSLK